jgi:hypothetical protein
MVRKKEKNKKHQGWQSERARDESTKTFPCKPFFHSHIIPKDED